MHLVHRARPTGVAPNLLSIHTCGTPSRHIVHLIGELDLSSAELLTAEFDHDITCGATDLRVDISQLTFLDCAGIGVLIAASIRLRALGRQFVIFGARPPIARVLALAGAPACPDVLIDGVPATGPSRS